MSLAAWVTLAVVIAMIVALARDWVSPPTGVMGAVIVLLVGGVVTPAQAFGGFANAAPITVAALYVLAAAVTKTGLLQPVLVQVLGRRGSRRGSLLRLCVPVAGASAFLNNTPIVAMLAPQVTNWAAGRNESPSRYLIPLSFATILGGTVTLIGTSTNVLVSGLLEASGQPPLGMFELTPVALPVAVVGVVLIVLLAPVVLPDRKPAREQLSTGIRDFVVGMRVEAGGPVDGLTIEQAGLRHLQGVFLVEIERHGEAVAPVAPTTVLQGEDLLTFVGRADLVVDLHARRGLISAEAKHLEHFNTARHTFFEAVVGAESPLVGKNIRELGFRGRYQAAVVAVHRAGQAIRAKLGDVRLRLGDTLLLLADPGFQERWRDRPDFLLMSRLGGAAPAVTRKRWIVALTGVAVVIVAGTGILPILQSALLAAVVLVAVGVLSPAEARGAVDMNVIVVIGASFGLGAAIESSGLARRFASYLVTALGSFGEVGLLLAIATACVVLNEAITNNATAALMFPIAMNVAAEMGHVARLFAVVTAIAASASFLTPIGYQTNTMVYGLGGYRFADYVRLGAPLTVTVLITLLLSASR